MAKHDVFDPRPTRSSDSYSEPRWVVYQTLDVQRRWQGRLLDFAGLGPEQTPSRKVLSKPNITLKAYQPAGAARAPAVLLIPAPIKQAYIWDMAPAVSVVRACMERNFRVYLCEWQRPADDAPASGLAAYADRLLADCIAAIAAETGQARTFLLGHSLGGTLAAVFTALHPKQVSGLVLLAAPVHFGADVGCFEPLAAAFDNARRAAPLPAAIPGAWLSMLSVAAAPATFVVDRYLDWLNSLSFPQALRRHYQVERWALDEMPMPRALFEDLVDQLLRNDRFMQGTLRLGRRTATPAAVTAPLLCATDARCRIVPPAAVLPFFRAAQSNDKKLIWYRGDVGVGLQHVGILIGRSAQRALWPAILDWVAAHA